MKQNIIVGIALVAISISAHARAVRLWSEAELRDASDLVVVGSPIKTKDLAETNTLGWIGTGSFRPIFRGVETTFKVSDVLKGMPANDKIVLHHYRVETEWGSPPNGPMFVSFPSNATNTYLLYLVNDGTNRYAPAAGQIDSVLAVKAPPTNSFGFPRLPPIAEADPSIRQPLLLHVPTKLTIERTTDMLSLEIDRSSLEITNLTVGTNMVTGVQNEFYIYPEGEPRPANGGQGLGGIDFNLGKQFWHTKPEGIPLPGKKYVVEVDLIVFETDIPPQHMWSPQGKNYKVLWQRTLKQTVE